MPSRNEDAERAVLGAMLIDNSIIPDVCVTVSETAFYSRKNRTAFNAIKDAWENDGVADSVTVFYHLQNAGKIDTVGQSYIAELASETATSANWKAHADIVLNEQSTRVLQAFAQQLSTLATAGDRENALSLARDYLDRATVETAQTDWDDMPTIGEFVKRVGDDDVEYLVDGLLMDGSTAILTSEPAAGKSVWALMLSFCVALGKPFLGRDVQRGGVLYFDYETVENLLSWRLGAVARGFEIEVDDVDLFRINALATDKLSTERGINTLSARIAAFRPSLVVFDTLRRVMGDLKENQSDDMAKILDAISEIKKRTGHTFSTLYLHHTVKDKEAQGLAKMRGSGDLGGQVDHVFLLEPKKDGRVVLESLKMRHGEPVKDTYRMQWDKTQVKFEKTCTQKRGNDDYAETA